MEDESKPAVETAPKARRKSPSKGKSRRPRPYPFELRLKLVKAYLEEQYPMDLLVQESGVPSNTVYTWVKRYRSLGEGGLHDAPPNRKVKRLPLPVREKIVAVKKENQSFGVKRISDLLRRFFWLRASPEAVRQTLKAAHLIETPRAKRRKNVDKPRFFERATPNQMWQSDIFMFRLGGTNAYLIGFIDDYSRYITGLELYRSQTGENVMEVVRRAFGEYGPPKEMLTDNGRQYTSWRGKTRFEAELKKEKIHHIKSQPHHPMTLGKIERFWATIYEEFLVRAQFTSFEEARERIQKWVKYYNHKRPHQGIGSLCPADRYFEIAAEMKRTLEAGIEENILEMALRGKPQAPFYMVGRLDGQSVVLRAEKGKLRLRVEDEKTKQEQEITYNFKEDKDGHEEAFAGEDKERDQGGADGSQGGHGDKRELQVPGSDGTLPSGPVCVDGAAQTHGGVPGDEGAVRPSQPMAGPGLGRDVAGSGTTGEPGEGGGAAAAAFAHPGEAEIAEAGAEDPFGAANAASSESEDGARGGGEVAAHRKLLRGDGKP